MVGTEIILSHSAETGNVVRTREENEQKIRWWLSIVFSNILMGIDKIQLI